MPFALTGGSVWRGGASAIRLAYHGCANRPFFHIVIQNHRDDRDDPPIEQIGTYDPMPNTENQKLISLNLERAQLWIGRGAKPTDPVAELFVHPQTYNKAWSNRLKTAAAAEAASAIPNDQPVVNSSIGSGTDNSSS